MNITSWLVDERPREKLLIKGVSSLSDAELLAIILRTGKKGVNAVELARDLLKSFGNIANLLSASQQDLCGYSGVGVSKYAQLKAAMELAKRQLQRTLEHKDVISNTYETKIYLKAHLQQYKKEVFACLFLDTRHQIIRFEEMFFGSISSSVVYPREVAKKALNYNAAAIIFAHNHPSGVTTPSQADLVLTRRLIEALGLIDVRVLDHIIVGESDVTSFKEKELM